MSSSIHTMGVLQIQAHRILMLCILRTLKKCNLTITEWSVLGITYENTNGIRLTEIAKILRVVTALITITVDALARKNLIIRLDHPNDKRAKLLFLTQKGKKLVPTVEKALQENVSPLFSGISKSELMTYQKVLEGIVTNYK